MRDNMPSSLCQGVINCVVRGGEGKDREASRDRDLSMLLSRDMHTHCPDSQASLLIIDCT
jgi:hypothetical protein